VKGEIEMSEETKLRVWKVTYCDWYAAISFREAVECAIADGMGKEHVFEDESSALTEEELRGMTICDLDDGPHGDNINGWDYLERLQATGRAAIFFASTEW